MAYLTIFLKVPSLVPGQLYDSIDDVSLEEIAKLLTLVFLKHDDFICNHINDSTKQDWNLIIHIFQVYIEVIEK